MTPKQLLNEVVPQKLAEIAGIQFPDIPVEMQVTIEGDEGGTWVMHTRGGKPQVKSGQATEPIVELKTNRSAFDMGFQRAGKQALEMDISGPVQFAVTMLPDAAKIDMIRSQMTGTLLFKVLTDDGDALFAIGFNGLADLGNPRCTIETSENELNEMREQRMAPQQAFLAGKIRLSGDLSLAMSAAMLLPMG